ncbi:MAG TPA: GerMN domain-containing protein [Candidatus Hydrogenedentes bacterium]|nr:GerMN domain-containing protein [Candidatus Hydrogenedentota bacterium]HOS03934.1 GerMN domain-containing protein [Candidatus Hydrogenedentota bacterium]
MSPRERQRFFRRVLLALWGLGTLILLFALGLIVHELQKEGVDPLALRTPLTPGAPPADTADAGTSIMPNTASLQEVKLYFARIENANLAPQTHHIPLGASTADNCRAAIAAIAQGPQPGLAPVLPSSAALRGIYLLPSGELVVDFSRELAMGLKRSASAEALMTQAIAHTVCQPSLAAPNDIPVRNVRFLVEGVVPQGVFDSHLDFSQPFAPETAWLAGATRRREP